MSSTGRTQVVDITYDDPRTGERIRERKVQEVPWEEIQEIRGQELARFEPRTARAPAVRRDDRDYYNGGRAYDDFYASRPLPRDRLAPPADDRYGYRYDRRSTDRPRGRRGDEYTDRRRRDVSSSSSSRSSSRSRRRRRRHRRAKSEQGSSREPQDDAGEEDDEGRLWYSGKPRREGNWRERHFDSSYDGLLAAAAGAAIGGITARSFAGPERKGWKIAGSAVAGATAFNLAENRFRVWTEERQEKAQRRGKGNDDDEGFVGPVEFGGHLLAGTAP